MPFVLDPTHPAQNAVRGDNIRDNVEQVYIANPVPGQTYTISVSLKGTMTYSSQPFSLIVSGLHRIQCQLTATILPTQDTTICAGTALVLRMATPSDNLTYQWLRNGAVLQNVRTDVCQADQSGSYVLRVTNSDGCSATSQPVQVQVRTTTAAIVPTGNQWICTDKAPIQLQATDASGAPLTGVVFEWLRDSVIIAAKQTSTLTINQPGRYQVRITQDGCQVLSATTTVQPTSVNVIKLIPEESDLMLPKGATVTLIAPVDTTYRYQWYRNDSTLTNATTYQLPVAQSGIYKVRITQQHCVGWSANRTVKSTVLTDTLPDLTSQFLVYPNPAERTLTIRYTNPLAKQGELRVFDLRGNLQQQLPLTFQNGRLEGEWSIQNLPPGYYILRLTGNFSTQVGRFLKK